MAAQVYQTFLEGLSKTKKRVRAQVSNTKQLTMSYKVNLDG
jgi:hypothetical protein